MQIEEVIVRECCDPLRDLTEYRGLVIKTVDAGPDIWFCKHCGQLWINAELHSDGELYQSTKVRLQI